MSIAEFCVKRPVFTTMLVTLFVVTGLFSFRDLSVDLLPKADPAVIQVSINLPGASFCRLPQISESPSNGFFVGGLKRLSIENKSLDVIEPGFQL